MYVQYIYNPCMHTTSEWLCICDLCGCIFLYLLSAFTFLLRQVLFLSVTFRQKECGFQVLLSNVFKWFQISVFHSLPVQTLYSGLFGRLPFSEQFIILPFKAAGSWESWFELCVVFVHGKFDEIRVTSLCLQLTSRCLRAFTVPNKGYIHVSQMQSLLNFSFSIIPLTRQ